MDALLEKISELKIDKETKIAEKPEYNLSKTALCYDLEILEDKSQSQLGWTENLKNAYEQLSSANGLLQKCFQVSSRAVKQDELEYLSAISGDLESNQVFNKVLGSSIELMEQVLKRNVSNGLIFTNHANIETHLAQYAIERYNIKRILIIDWDINHNLSVQKSFYDNSRVLYFSIHQYKHGLQPAEADFDCIGEENGKGFNINMPLSSKGYGDTEYMAIFYNLLLPLAYEFSPEIILLPTSFDACMSTSDAQIKISPFLYAHFLNSLSCLADGRLCLLVNGKFSNLKIFSDCTLLALRTLIGFPCPRLKSINRPNTSTVETILNSIAILRPYWYSLQLLNDNDVVSLDEFIELNKEKKKNSQVNGTTKMEAKTRTPLRSNSQSIDRELNEMLDLEKQVVGRTCICTDERMMLHYNLAEPGHPEQPDRIKRIMAALKEKNLFQQCTSIESRYATEDEITLCHTKEYIDSLKELKKKTNEELIKMSNNLNSVYFNSETYECALLAAGCLLNVTDQVCSKNFKNGVSVSRPPGHHADCTSCSGFCFFNSVGIAARYAQQKYLSIKKVLILDFDIHHGNGTQDIFKDDESVLFISLHRYDDGNFYPVGAQSNYNFVGTNEGKGFTVNVPWSLNPGGGGDAEYVAAFLRVVMPIAYQFNPDLVFISAGFDGAVGDPLGRYNITVDGYAQMTKMLSTLANGNVIVALEGGYNLTSISESMSSCVSILLGQQLSSLPPINAKPQAYATLKNVQIELAQYWSCFQFNKKLPSCTFLKAYKKSKNQNLNATNENINVSRSGNSPYALRRRKIDGTESPSSSPRIATPVISTPRTSTATPSVRGVESPLTTKSLNLEKPAMASTPSSARISRNKVSPAILVELTGVENKPLPKETAQTTSAKQNDKDLNEIIDALGSVKLENVKIEPQRAEAAAGEKEVYDFVITNEDYEPACVVPLPYCPHLLEISSNVNREAVNANASCEKCHNEQENWICLTCFTCQCSRYVKGHMAKHFELSNHAMALSYSDMSVWCYVCEAYVHNELLRNVKDIAYASKFGEE